MRERLRSLVVFGALAGALFGALASAGAGLLAVAACGSAYAAADDVPDAGEAGNDAQPDSPSPADACAGVICGARCCASGKTCVDGGTCSNDVLAISAGGAGACVLVADGTVWCWGDNAVGQVGVGAGGDDMCTFINAGSSTVDSCRFNATKVAGLPAGISHVASGYQLACAVVGADGSVWCWGTNYRSALGHDPALDPTCTDSTKLESDGAAPQVPCSSMPRKVEGISGVVELTITERTTCARKSDSGGVFCWGDNLNGELGDPGTSAATTFTPVRVKGLPADIVQISSALYAEGLCALAADGTAWCWGCNVPDQPCSSFASPLAPDGGVAVANLASVQPAVTHVCALAKGGAVICWGRNDNAQLGTLGCDQTQDHSPATVIGLPSVVALQTRWFHTCAIDQTARVWCWGLAQDGALGRGNISGESSCSGLAASGTASVVPNLPRITQLATGIETTYAVAEDGTVWAWGVNDLARLGHVPKTQSDLLNCGDPENRSVCNPSPERVQGLP